MGTANPKFNLISSEHLEGASVFDANGKEVGKIDRLLIDKASGQVRYAIIDFSGFMGLRHDAHAVPWTAMAYDGERDRYTADVTEQTLEASPGCMADSAMNREWEAKVHQHYKTSPYWEGQSAEREGRSAGG